MTWGGCNSQALTKQKAEPSSVSSVPSLKSYHMPTEPTFYIILHKEPDARGLLGKDYAPLQKVDDSTQRCGRIGLSTAGFSSAAAGESELPGTEQCHPLMCN